MKKYISQRLRTLRKKAQMSQEQLANKLGVTTQAVSKWECDLAYPDIELLMQIADIYAVTIDSLLREPETEVLSEEEAENQTETSEKNVTALEANQPADDDIETGKEEPISDMFDSLHLPDDDVIRVVQFRGRRPITRDMLEDDIVIPIRIGSEHGFLFRRREVNIEIWGNVHVDGDIVGNLQAGGTVECGDVNGNVETNGSLNCGDVSGNAHAGGNMSCGDVLGNANCGGHLECGDIAGNVYYD